MRLLHHLTLFLIFLAPMAAQAQPASFEKAKTLAREQVYHDRNVAGDLYCGCTWRWVGRSGGRTNLAECGYQIRAQQTRAERTEWEHIVPASNFGRQRQCWQNGGRSNCTSNDPVFGRMEADLHNLTPVVGEVNADRSNFNLGMVASSDTNYGRCPFKVSFKDRVAEPPNWAKGFVARVHFYMADRYNLQLSAQQVRVLMAWDRQYPVSHWELERDRRIAPLMGHSNPFVTGQRTWTEGYRPTGWGLAAPAGAAQSRQAPVLTPAQAPTPLPAVIGNKNSQIYHVRGRCPDADRVGERNRVAFESEAQAQAAGFRRAGNCR